MPRADPYRVSQPLTRRILSASDEAILRALARYSYLTSTQICRLLFSTGSLTYAQTKLKRLGELGYCQRLFLPRPGQFGSAPSLWALGRKGLNVLAAQGADTPHRYRPSEQQASWLFLPHTLAVNDVLIGLEQLCHDHTDLKVQAVVGERQLRREPVYIELEGKRTSVIPDAWVDLLLAGSQQLCVAFEVDRSSEAAKQWRRKVRTLLAYSHGPYQEHFGTDSLTIGVVATGGENRRDELLCWTEAELVAVSAEHEADLFRFTALPASLDPGELFLSPEWLRPFDANPVPLLGLDAVGVAAPEERVGSPPGPLLKDVLS